MAGKRLEDSRTGRNTRHGLLPLIRQSIYSRLAGYEDVNDAERLCVDQAYGTSRVAAPANRRRLGKVAWSPRSSGTPTSRPVRGLHRHESCVASKESGQVRIAVKRRSNASRRTRMPSGGLGSPARPSRQTTLVCNSSPWRTTSGTSSAGWHFQSVSSVVANHAEGEARQDRCQGHPARQVRDVPAGGSRRATTTLCFDPRTDRQI